MRIVATGGRADPRGEDRCLLGAGLTLGGEDRCLLGTGLTLGGENRCLLGTGLTLGVRIVVYWGQG